jgi:hypothetical protein
MTTEPVRKYRTEKGLESRVEDIDNLKKKELIDRVYDLLKEHANLDLPITYSSINMLYVDEIKEFYRFLLNPSKKEGNKKRPRCPVANKKSHGGKITFPYKAKMVKYIAEWGFRFKNPSYLVPSMLEAAANYLESRTGKQRRLRVVRKKPKKKSSKPS